ncbi:MAG: DUF4129 domain-containing protein [Thermoplasmatota archaeon]
MKKSLVMLVLLAMLATSFIGLASSASDAPKVNSAVPGVDADIIRSNGDAEEVMEELDDDPAAFDVVEPRTETPIFRDEPLPDFGPKEEGRSWPFLEEEERDPSRGAVNTSTLLYIQKVPKKVYYGDTIELEGLLLEDNNSDGERNSGDLPIEKEFVNLLWADGTEWMFQADLMTEWDNQELNMTPGRFSMPSKFLTNETGVPLDLNANISSIAANGDRGVELVLTYKGVWTTNGAVFYNLTQDVYNKLWNTKIGEDDDGDASRLQSNGIDDDGDGVIDDGAPGIPKIGNPEGVDEEILDGLNNDGDAFIDEDPYAFIARRGYEKRLYIEIWHKTKTTVDVVGSDLIDVGNTFTVRGTIEDTSYEYTTMGAKTMRLFWDGQPVAETTAVPSGSNYFSQYEFTYRVPDTASAGPHTVAVEFSPGFNITNNYYFDPSNATTTIYVRRPTKVIFNDVDPNLGVTWVYRGSTIWINGSIVDKLYYEREYIHEGPRLTIGSQEYGNQYRFNVMWGDPVQPFAKFWTGLFIIDDWGNFSIEYELPAGSQPLGSVTVTVETNFDESRYHDPLIFYSNSENSTKFMVRARTDIKVWIDQNDNGINDETEQDQWGNPLQTFITRKPFTGSDGKVRDWNKARIRGVLKDLTQSSGSLEIGVPNQRITLKWNAGKGSLVEKEISLVTDANGRFEYNVDIEATHSLGPVPVRITYSEDYYTNYYDSSTYYDNDGQPFSVVSFTTLTVNATTAVKGKNVMLSGSLLDDNWVGIGNRTVILYRLDFWDGNYNSLYSSGGLGTRIGTATTNSLGKFTFTEYVVEERMSVGSVWVVARFVGSQEFPYGLGSIRYLPNDAFMPQISQPDKMVITSETHIKLETIPDYLVRNGEARITGKLLESYRGMPDNTKGVSGQTINAYLKQGEEVFKMGVGRTKSDPNLPEFNGFFEIKTTNVPSKLTVGKVEVIVEFEPEISTEGVPLYQPSSNITEAEVWSSTRVKEIFFKPTDIDGDRRIDLFEDQPEDWVFTWQILEGSTEVTSGDPVTYGVIYLNITMGPYTNTTRALTDIRGRVHFNFTTKFKDTATGNTFSIPADQKNANLTMQIKFLGKQGYTESVKTYFCTYNRAKPVEPEEFPWAVFFLILFVLFLITCVVLFFFYKYIERRRRLKALKKIIKKAADQLETGNPYSAVIFKAYQKMGAHLRRYGFMRRDADTFREFEDAVRAALPIDERSLDQFLDILEEARYSKHVIGSGHKDRAINCLRNVESSLDNIILDEEAALRQMELADEDIIETQVKYTGESKEAEV